MSPYREYRLTELEGIIADGCDPLKTTICDHWTTYKFDALDIFNYCQKNKIKPDKIINSKEMIKKNESGKIHLQAVR